MHAESADKDGKEYFSKILEEGLRGIITELAVHAKVLFDKIKDSEYAELPIVACMDDGSFRGLMLHGAKRQGGVPHPSPQVDEIDNLGTFLLRVKGVHDLVDTPRSFITRILKAEEEMEKCQRLWAAMPQTQMDDKRDPHRNFLDSEYKKFTNEIKTLGLAGVAEVMKYQRRCK